MNYRNILLNKINLKKSTIGIIGLGYVGLPLAGVFAKKNFNVIGFDIDEIFRLIHESEHFIIMVFVFQKIRDLQIIICNS